MEAIHHDLHALTQHLFGCMHKPFLHICTYGVDRVAQTLGIPLRHVLTVAFLRSGTPPKMIVSVSRRPVMIATKSRCPFFNDISSRPTTSHRVTFSQLISRSI